MLGGQEGGGEGGGRRRRRRRRREVRVAQCKSRMMESSPPVGPSAAPCQRVAWGL